MVEEELRSSPKTNSKTRQKFSFEVEDLDSNLNKIIIFPVMHLYVSSIMLLILQLVLQLCILVHD